MLPNISWKKYQRNISKEDLYLIQKIPSADQIIKSHAFQRLKGISFLGAIEYLVHDNQFSKNIKSSRYDHTLSVANLARIYCMRQNFDKYQTERVVVSALLHDIGHPPLSHSMEKIFKFFLGKDHKDLGVSVINYDLANQGEVPRILRDHGIDTREVNTMISGQSKEPGSELFSSKFNIDTLDGIYRSKLFINPSSPETPPEALLIKIFVERSNTNKEMDSFWELKNNIYQHLINGRIGIIADRLCQIYGIDAKITEEDALSTEKQLRKNHPNLFRLLRYTRSILHRLVVNDPPSGLSATVATDLANVQYRDFIISQNERDLTIATEGRYRILKRLIRAPVVPALEHLSGVSADAFARRDQKPSFPVSDDKRLRKLF